MKSVHRLLDWIPTRGGTFSLAWNAEHQFWLAHTTDGGRTFWAQSTPAWLRTRPGGGEWGQAARDWLGRAPGVESLFEEGVPREPAAVRDFLRWVLRRKQNRKGTRRCFVALPQDSDWARELWTEAGDDTPLKISGFISPLQRVLALRPTEWRESALRRVALLDLSSHECRWYLSQLDGPPRVGVSRLLSTRVLRDALGQYFRSKARIEVPEEELDRLLREPEWPSTPRLRGKQLSSGLPCQRYVDSRDFWQRNPALEQVLERFRARLFEQLGGVSVQERLPNLKAGLLEQGYLPLWEGPGWSLLQERSSQP